MDVITYALGKHYTDDAILGTTGPLKGKPCTISSIESITGGHRVTFLWYDNSGSSHTSFMDVMDGAEVTSIYINDENKHIIFVFSDGREIDGGEIPSADEAEEVAYDNSEFPELTNVKLALDEALSGGAKLSNSLTVSNPVGSATNGKVYAKNTDLETIIRDMLIKEVAPGLTLTITPSTTLYDKVTETVSEITLTAVVTKNTYNLSKVDFYLGNVLKHSQEISAAGTYQYTITFDEPTNDDFSVKAIVYDNRSGTPMSNTKSINVKFTGRSYYGTVSSTTGEPSASIIKALENNVLKDTKNLTYANITMTYGKIVYAYPAVYGDLTYIMDEQNNLSYLNSFVKSVLTIDGISYNCYTQSTASGADDIEIVFR